MNRERQLARAFVDLADTYASEFDPLHLFSRLVRTCVELLDVDAAAVMVADARGSLKTMAATSDEAAFVELLQAQTGSGPCMECYRTGEPRSVPDITAEGERWPELATAMTDAGYRSLQTVPVRLHERPLGGLTLLGYRVGALADDDVHLAQALADSAALALMHWSIEPARSDDVITRVQSAISAKALLEIAKGMIAEYADVSIPEAGQLLTGYASRHRVSLAETVHALVSHSMKPTVIVPARKA
ncbi:GAF and ANTAR domain-containing protein [Streptomyces sp. NPDC047042]|uniref:GAF and ANTAR domain-containing protein n=1 Tax=Streptomyces sp. NPDC047042 TaxID=3154807 RepID=UPI0033D87411